MIFLLFRVVLLVVFNKVGVKRNIDGYLCLLIGLFCGLVIVNCFIIIFLVRVFVFLIVLKLSLVFVVRLI